MSAQHEPWWRLQLKLLCFSFTCLWRPAVRCGGVWDGMRAGGETAGPGRIVRPPRAHWPGDLSKDGGKIRRKNTDGWSTREDWWEAVDTVQADGANVADNNVEGTWIECYTIQKSTQMVIYVSDMTEKIRNLILTVGQSEDYICKASQ